MALVTPGRRANAVSSSGGALFLSTVLRSPALYLVCWVRVVELVLNAAASGVKLITGDPATEEPKKRTKSEQTHPEEENEDFSKTPFCFSLRGGPQSLLPTATMKSDFCGV